MKGRKKPDGPWDLLTVSLPDDVDLMTLGREWRMVDGRWRMVRPRRWRRVNGRIRAQYTPEAAALAVGLAQLERRGKDHEAA